MGTLQAQSRSHKLPLRRHCLGQSKSLGQPTFNKGNTLHCLVSECRGDCRKWEMVFHTSLYLPISFFSYHHQAYQILPNYDVLNYNINLQSKKKNTERIKHFTKHSLFIFMVSLHSSQNFFLQISSVQIHTPCEHGLVSVKIHSPPSISVSLRMQKSAKSK